MPEPPPDIAMPTAISRIASGGDAGDGERHGFHVAASRSAASS